MTSALRASLVIASLFLHIATADTVRVMTTGLGEGSVTAPGINCGAISGTIDCNESGPITSTIVLTATSAPGTTFASWGGDCPDTDPSTPANQCRVTLSSFRSVRAQFDRTVAITPLTEAQISDVAATRSGIGDYLAAHPEVNTVAEFIAALPVEYRRDWILMPRSESLQTGTAERPRILMPNTRATNAFAISLREPHDPSYPASHTNAVEFMQWDDAQKTFRFHEIVLAPIPDKDDTNPDPAVFTPRFLARRPGVAIDDTRCFACHSTRNVLNRGTTAGTDGVSRDVPVKLKPNWDAYDSWGGMLSFNRDRIYKGSVEAAAFRKLFNLWTWRDEPAIRAIVEQLELQPPDVPDGSPTRTRRHSNDDGSVLLLVVVDDRITRLAAGGPNDGHIVFGFDAPGAPTITEPQPAGPGPTVTYEFNRRPGTAGTPVARDPSASPTDTYPYTQFVTLHHSLRPRSDVGRGVTFLSQLSDEFIDETGTYTGPNAKRVADEVKTHRYATGSVPFDVRPLALAIASRCITATGGTDIAATQAVSPAAPAAVSAFFDARNGMTFDQVYDDTRRRQNSLPLRKADIQKLTLDRTADTHVLDENGPANPPAAPEVVNGLIQQYGGATSGVSGGTGGLDTNVRRLRQEVFRRPIDRGRPDQTVMGGILVDRENHSVEVEGTLALFRYFLEPLGVSVDKWSTGVRGRSRTYTFSGSIASYIAALNSPDPGSLRESLGIPATTTDVCPVVMPMVTASYAALPAATATPTYTDIQRIFNKSCIECHGGLGYPPFRNYGGIGQNFNLSEDDTTGANRFARSYGVVSGVIGADPATSWLYQRITDHGQLAHPYNPGQPFNIANPDDALAPDVADERCPDGLMPCGGPPLSKVDIETIRRWIEGSAPNTEGDPHIRTVDGVHYDFQAAGEFTLLRDAGLELQARQTPVPTAAPIADAHTGLTACVSINSAVALRVGKHRVTYQPDLAKETRQPGAMTLRIDGKPVELGTAAHALAGGGRVLKTSAPGGVQVQAPGGTVVVVTPGVWLGVSFLNVNVTRARATEGIMGAIAPGNWLPALPDGTLLGARPADPAARHAALYKRFADAWRVNETTSLFDYESGLSPRAFAAERWPELSPQACNAPALPGVPVAATPPTPLPQAEAEKLCAAVVNPARKKNCIADVAATGARAFAETYLATEKLLTRPKPRAPDLRTPANNAVIPAANVRFEWTKPIDPAAQGLTFRHCLWNNDQLYDFNKCAVVAESWTPRQEDWLNYAIIAGVALLLALVLWFATGGRLIVVILLSFAVALWAGLQVVLIHTGRSAGTTTIERLDPGKTYRWKVVAEDADGNIIESETRRLVVR